MSQACTFRLMVAEDHEDVALLARSLPEWFSPASMDHIPVDVTQQHGVVAIQDGKLVGFATWFVNEGDAQIGWIAVARQLHRRGIGRKLVRHVIDLSSKFGVSHLRVWTLSDSVDYPPYEATRRFYAAQGLKPWRRVPGYCDDGSEMLIYRRPFREQRDG